MTNPSQLVPSPPAAAASVPLATPSGWRPHGDAISLVKVGQELVASVKVAGRPTLAGTSPLLSAARAALAAALSNDSEISSYRRLHVQLVDAEKATELARARVAESEQRRRVLVLSAGPGLASALQAVDADLQTLRAAAEEAQRDVDTLHGARRDLQTAATAAATAIARDAYQTLYDSVQVERARRAEQLARDAGPALDALAELRDVLPAGANKDFERECLANLDGDTGAAP